MNIYKNIPKRFNELNNINRLKAEAYKWRRVASLIIKYPYKYSLLVAVGIARDSVIVHQDMPFLRGDSFICDWVAHSCVNNCLLYGHWPTVDGKVVNNCTGDGSCYGTLIGTKKLGPEHLPAVKIIMRSCINRYRYLRRALPAT